MVISMIVNAEILRLLFIINLHSKCFTTKFTELFLTYQFVHNKRYLSHYLLAPSVRRS